MPRSDLDQRLLRAHAEDDLVALVDLYSEAAAASADIEAKSFYLTHAYVFALEHGDPRQSELKKTLVDLGREVPN